MLDADRVGAAVAVAGAARRASGSARSGRGGSKLVSRRAARKQASRASRRARAPVVVGATGIVCWVVGYRIDDRVRVTTAHPALPLDRSVASPPNARTMNDPNIGRIVVDEHELQQRIRDLGKEITADYDDDPPLLVGILKGAFMFMADLARAIDLPVEFDFMAVSSYGSATRTSGVVRIMKDLDLDLTDRHVLIVEDIVDSGLTLAYLRKNLKARGPASLEVCALLVKEGLQKTDPDLKYVGFRIPPDFVIGYGLDVDERYRNLPFIAEYAGPVPSS